MSATVYFWNLRASHKAPFDKRMRSLLKAASADTLVTGGDLAAVKLHFGEQGTTGFLRPLWIREIVDFLSRAGAKPFLTDASTLYVGQRGEAVSHSLCAARHGWDPLALGAPVIIADGLKGGDEVAVPVGGKHIADAYIASAVAEADFLVSVNHFKGHEMAGYGGALKNIGMGCASKKGKMHQHFSTGPEITIENCTGCGSCLLACKTQALSLDAETGRIALNAERCVGCGGCFVACRFDALNVNWKIGIQEFLERMMEYALAVVRTKRKPCLHINFVMDVVPDCDCVGFTDAPICPDIGVLVSLDPVAVDQASLDLVNAAQPLHPSQLPFGVTPGQNKFLAIHPHVPEAMGLDYAEAIGLGTRQYELLPL
ncbi:MAG: DUF362 domain-containing protein [Pseudodesulfovibrio sp.]|uniref:4Fe-4S ferredoxin-type domain-containing protein n=1 Tax=Pseudodesulfovibrio aespoeensis (strain ATCC 700646 / DSM 10631 / Aspo-2) TaxID=643562 RepID=E6VSD3_PSEA9|nr:MULTISPECIES: DUF362 domain-containing protein [Pseudodesulfovibrio]MBU4192291.1 DUF362 domain-containing protein [Pseudomonadota bacterium]ADU64276.1 Protein of unknown function DUF2088 [Pseudodesulfovibrio aespoeensis Aspo-2]MBU4243686.1 DUF362 domain-containing protein [Pseudomonadota bacterium]MBU4378412.1 DUF362 domain-containing protein [Pseudomonadota bacterium]MBU4475654.1 DUF362 domain-containing protein [Pseudomonadota bacterium]